MFVGKTLKAGMTPISKDESYLFVLDHHKQDVQIPQQDLPKRLSQLLGVFGDNLNLV